MPALKLSRLLPFVAAAIVIGGACANLLHWYGLGNTLMISDDAEFWNWGIPFFDRRQAFPSGVGQLRELLGGRGTALPLLGPGLLLLFGGSVSTAVRFYSCGCLAAFLFAAFLVGRRLPLGGWGAVLFLACLASDPYLFKGFECFFSEPPYLVGLLFGLALLLRGRFLAAGAVLGAAAWFRPFEAARIVGVGTLTWLSLEALRARGNRREALTAVAAVAASLLLFRLAANFPFLRALFALPCLVACRPSGRYREPLRAVSLCFAILTVWLLVAGDVVWNWVQASSGAVGGASLDALAPERIVSALLYDAYVLEKFLGWGGCALALAAAGLIAWKVHSSRDASALVPVIVAAGAWAFSATLAGLAPLRESAMAASRFFLGEYALFLALGTFTLAIVSRGAAFGVLGVLLASNLAGICVTQYHRQYPYSVTSEVRGHGELVPFGENPLLRDLYERLAAVQPASDPLRMVILTKEGSPWIEDQLNVYFVDRGARWRVLSATRGERVLYPIAGRVAFPTLRARYPEAARFLIDERMGADGVPAPLARIVVGDRAFALYAAAGERR